MKTLEKPFPPAIFEDLRGSKLPAEEWERRLIPVAGVGQVGVWVAKEYTHLSPASLLHLAMLGPLMGLVASEGFSNWRMPQGFGEGIPDALCDGPGGVWAVEVDLGYNTQKVRKKVAAYREQYAGQLWGVSSRTRYHLVLASAWPGAVRVVRIGIPNGGA